MLRMFTHAFLLILLLVQLPMQAQKFLEMMQDPDADFYEVQRMAEEYFKDHGTGKGSGYKAFKRWEYERLLSMNSSGMQTARQVWNEHEKLIAARKARPAAKVGNVYTELGPHKFNVTAHYSPGMGRVTYISVDPQNNQVIYSSGVGGVWKTTNGGTSWIPLTDHLPAVYSNCVEVHPTNSNLVLAGISGLGILKSTNGGISWTNTSLTNGNPKKIIYNPANPSVVLVASTNGIFRSTDAGSTFTLVQGGGFNDLDFKPGDPSIVYACGNTFFRSTNNGSTFSLITAGLTTSGRSFLAVTPANPNYVYVVQAKGEELGFVFRSSNSGASFTTQLAANPANGTNYFGYNPREGGGQAGYDMAITASPTNANKIIIGGINLWGSNDGGVTYYQVSEWTWGNPVGYVHADVHALEWVGSAVYCGSDGGLFKSINEGDDWSIISFGKGNREFYRIGGIESDPYFIGGGSQDNGQSILLTKNVNNWRDWAGADGMEVVIDYNNKNNVYACLQNGGLWKSTNGGMSRTGISEPPGGGGNWVTPLFIDPVSPSTIYIGYRDVWKSTNGGASWTKISSFGTSSGLEAATIAPSNNQFLYAADGGTMWVTKNGGTSWTNITAGLSGGINYISVHPTDANKVSVITNSGVFKSDNAGTNWTNVTFNLPNIGKRCIVYQKNPEDILYVGLSVGVYYLKPGTTTWVDYFDGLPNVPVSELEINYSIGMLRVATSGRGLWEAPIIKNSTGNLAPSISLTSPANNASFLAPASISLTATASDADGSVSKVEFFQGSTLIGTDLSAPYSFTWTNVPAGTYTLTAKATDNLGAFSNTTGIVVVVSNPPCTVSGAELRSTTIIGTDGSWNNLGDDKGKAVDGNTSTFFDSPMADGSWVGFDLGRNATVSGVRFFPRAGFEGRMTGGKFQGSNSATFATVTDLATIAGVPGLEWNCITVSNASNFRYLRYLSPVGSNGNVAEISFYGTYVNTPPTILLTAPVNNATFSAPASVTISANASDADGSISKVDFYNGTTLLGTDATAPYSMNWSGVAAGTYSISARATDNSGAVANSAVAVITVNNVVNNPPQVSITSPLNNASFLAPASVSITAAASDADGSVAKVDFYNGATLLGTDISAPYSFSWTNVLAGTYTLSARVTDNLGAVTSASISIVVTNPVNTPPQVSITAPLSNATFTAPATIAIAANASDADGSISKVDFYQGSTLLGTDLSAPYSFSWIGVVAGNYTLTARATDNAGAVATSAAVTITVNTVSSFGINGPSCIDAGQTVLYTLVPDVNAITSLNWWSNSGATTTIDATDNKKATYAIPAYMNGTTFTVYCGVNFSQAPWYKEYSKTVKVGGCSASPAPVSAIPQPFEETTVIFVPNAKIISVFVTDTKGNLVMQVENILEDSFEFGKDLPAGYYSVRVVAEDGEHTTKVVKTK
ncbi:MAG: Ig-like domain-containing protein [Cytophagaceae bacterium]|nr:Ig-like domain-containing protein [Cytophagaceae bacterium]